MSDTSFERFLLADVVAEARKLGAVIKDGSVCLAMRQPSGNKCYLFEYGSGKDHFSTEVWAAGAYHARALGWEAWIARQTRPVEWKLTYALSHESYGGHDHNDGSVTVTVRAASRTEAIKRGATKVKRSNPMHEAKLTTCGPTV